MEDVLMDTLIDSVKLLPFLFIVFLIMEYIEHKVSKKNKKTLEKAGKFGPVIGSLLGAFPQCGFGVAATNLYATRIITLGTLISIYLSTSDEMLPILISEKADIKTIIYILITKVIVGMIFGVIIDFILRKKNKEKDTIKDFCEVEHCHCDHGIFISSIKHTLNIFIFILIINFILNTLFYYFDVKTLCMKNSIFTPFITSLIGLIPNCGASVAITELFLRGTISMAAVISGLLTSAGVGLLVLFKVNKNLKENLKIVLLLYFIGVTVGIIMELFGL